MKILVTGASGFIGQEIVSELIENNYQVIGLQHSRHNLAPNAAKLEYHKADITDYKTLSDFETFENVEVIIHSAGLAHQFGETKREDFERINVLGTENVLNLAVKLGVKHFILIGSTAVYGIPPIDGIEKNYTESTPTNPQTLYAESKLEAEKVCRKICLENNIALTIFRLAPVIGEGNVGNVARLISAIDKRRFVWIGDGRNLKSLIYKRDVGRACAVLIKKKHFREEIFNLAAEPVRMKDFVAKIAETLNVKLFPVTIPAIFPRVFFKVNSKLLKNKKIDKISDTIEKWLAEDVYSADKISGAYGFKPQTSTFEGLFKQIEFYRNEKADQDVKL